MKTNWQIKKLGDVVSIKKGKNPDLFMLQKEGMLPYLGAKFMRGTKDAEFALLSDKKSVPVSKNDLIIICDGSKSGDMFSGFEGILSSTMGKIEFDENVISHLFLKAFFDLNFELFNGSKKGAAIPHLDFTVFKELEIPLPSLEIQKEIVAKLDAKFAKLREAKRLREEALNDTEKILSQTLREIFEEGKQKGWEETALKEICSLITDGKHGDSKNHDNSGYYFLSAKDVKNDILNYQNARQIAKDDFEETHRRTDLKPGDVLITNSGTIGRIAIAIDDPKTYKTTFQKSVAVLKPINNKIISKFLTYILRADLEKLIKVSSGSAQKNLLLGDLKKHIVLLPSLPEQKEIVTKLDILSEKIRALRELQTSQLADLKRLEKSYLREAFNGEL